MKLVVLDSYVAVSTDLSLDCLQGLCDEMQVYDRTPPEETAARIGSAELVLINKTVLSREVLAQCPSVRYIGLFATGYNVVDVDYCRERGIVVANAPAYSTDSVAQLVFAYLLHFACLADKHSQEVHQGAWQNCRDFAFYDPKLLIYFHAAVPISLVLSRIISSLTASAGSFPSNSTWFTCSTIDMDTRYSLASFQAALAEYTPSTAMPTWLMASSTE